MQNDDPDTKPCAHCAAPLPRTGTYCLACDTPVSATPLGLSVADAVTVRRGRPLAGVAMVGLLALVLGGLALALVLVVRPHPQPHQQADGLGPQNWTRAPASMSRRSPL